VYPALIIMSQWQIQDFEKGGLVAIAGWRRHGIEARSVDPSVQSTENFSPSFFPYQDGLSCTFTLCTASSRCRVWLQLSTESLSKLELLRNYLAT